MREIILRAASAAVFVLCAGVVRAAGSPCGGWGYDLTPVDGETALVFTNTAAKAIRWTVPAGVTKLEALVVGGGGGGGYGGANEKGSAERVGGGGGGFAQARTLAVSAGQTVTVSVGAGGAGGTYETYDGFRGGDSSLVCGEVALTSLGGGFGGGCCLGMARPGGAGGCGGGGAILGDGGGVCEQGDSGWGWQASSSSGGAGAGAGERASGNRRNSFKRFDGGAGLTNAITGVAVEYGRGGDGSSSDRPVRDGVNGTGAGGSGGFIIMGGRGGDGVVVLRFRARDGMETPVEEFDDRPLGGKPVALSPCGGQKVALLTPLQKEFFSKQPAEREQLLSEVGTAYRNSLYADLVNPAVPPTLSWSGTVGRCTVTVVDAADGSVCFTGATEASSVKVNTLRAGASYRWTVTSADGQVGEAAFSVEPDVPHLIVGDWGALNARDLGGYAGLGGKRVRQGVAWRMTRFTQTLQPSATALDPGRCFFWTNTVGIRTEIDLRDTDLGSSGLGPNVKYVFCKIGIYTMTDRDRENQIKAFRVFLDPKNYPIAFHCSGGRDRTGTLAYLLSGLLGVSDDDLEKDFGATWLRLPDESLADNRRGDRSLDCVIAVVDACAGATRAERIASYFKSGGVTDEEIALFRKNLLVDETESPDEPPTPPEPPSGDDDPEPEPAPVVGAWIVQRFDVASGEVEWTVPVRAVDVEFLAIGGGGAGGNYFGGGGGAGGVVTGSLQRVAGRTLVVHVGAGGASAPKYDKTNATAGEAGGATWFSLDGERQVMAPGGGGGASAGVSATAGGSGGGGSQGAAAGGVCEPEPFGSCVCGAVRFGNAGGAGATQGGAGGGGAGTTGGNGASKAGGNGGAGLLFGITGEDVLYAGGGAGAGNSAHGAGGAGGGGDVSSDGLDGLGGGGGGTKGAGGTVVPSGRGGNGVLIVRYRMRPSGLTLYLL